MLDKLFDVADWRVALVSVTVSTLAFLIFGKADPRKETRAALKGDFVAIGFTPRPALGEIKKMLGEYEKNPAYVERERRALFYDYFLILVYACVLTLASAFALKTLWPDSYQSFRFLALMPILAGLFDVIENLTFGACLGRDPEKVSALLVVSRAATMLKLLLLAAACLLILAGWLKFLWTIASRGARAART